MQVARPALFLDRDGVINVEKHYLYRIEDFEFIQGVFDACRYFQHLGYLIVVVTNQSGIERGYYSEADFQKLTQWMLARFKEQGVDVAKVYHCPHHPELSGACDCRKPKPGMLLAAQEELAIDLSRSILVGDKLGDIQAGKVAGVGMNVLVHSGHKLADTALSQADFVMDSLADFMSLAQRLNLNA
jgi:D-glycero-D-manno-heptose 1,7-bisphosphate phosphatase